MEDPTQHGYEKQLMDLPAAEWMRQVVLKILDGGAERAEVHLQLSNGASVDVMLVVLKVNHAPKANQKH